MSLKLNGATSGSIELDVPAAIGSDLNITIPATAGEVAVKGTDGSVDLGNVDIDSSGRLLVGSFSARSNLSNAWGAAFTPPIQVETGGDTNNSGIALINNSVTTYSPTLSFACSRANTIGSNTIIGNGQSLGTINWSGSDGTNFLRAAEIATYVDGTPGANDMPGRLVFSTTADGASSPTERMRISNNGYTSIYGNNDAFDVRVGASAGTSNAFLVGRYSASGVLSGGTASIYIWSNGNIENTNNSYTGISDIKLKENIVDANSQWDDIKALRPVNYNFKEGQTHTQLGLIAQEVELVSPGLVSESPDRDEDGNDLGTVTKSVNYSVLYMKAVKALQEAMERIETLEAKVAALESA